MLKQYKTMFILIFCMTCSNIHSMSEAPSCTQIIIGWVQSCYDKFLPDELISAREVCSIKKIQYYLNQSKVTVHFRLGHVLDLSNGPTDYQANLFKAVKNNFNEIIDKNGDHPYYHLVKCTTLNSEYYSSDDNHIYFVTKK